jgi:hypothetical protein
MMSLLARDLPRCGSAPSAATRKLARPPCLLLNARKHLMHCQQTSDRQHTKLTTRSHRRLGQRWRTSSDPQRGQRTCTAVSWAGISARARVHALDPGGCRKANRIVSSRPARPPICRPMTHPRCSACEFSFTIIIEEPPDKGVGICANHGCLKYGERQAFVSVPGPPAATEAI